uniref:Uncharacterized protein n=1 Tax=Oryza barthii TaxID=65489 RepID=A0A0D3FCM4_9ORYZ
MAAYHSRQNFMSFVDGVEKRTSSLRHQHSDGVCVVPVYASCSASDPTASLPDLRLLSSSDDLLLLLPSSKTTRQRERQAMELEAPSPARYLVGAAIMMAGVVLPLAYMIFRSKRSSSSSTAVAASSAPSSSFSKQTK